VSDIITERSGLVAWVEMASKMGDRFATFTERARKVIQLAHEESARLAHS